MNAACAEGTRVSCIVLRARGGEGDRKSPFAILDALVDSAASYVRSMDQAFRQTKAVAVLVEKLRAGHLEVRERSSLFYSLIVALRDIGPVVLAIDDADMADQEAVGILQQVVRRLENQQIWLLVAAGQHHSGVGLRPVDSILTEPGTRHFVLGRLQAESVRAMLADYFCEEPDPTFVAACCELTGGTPLFLTALLPAFSDQQIFPSAAMVGRVERVTTPRITQLILSRLARLPVAAADLMQATAILGDRADSMIVCQLAKIDVVAAERAADAAAQMELLSPGHPYSFRVPLIRWSILEDIPSGRRSRLHSNAAQLVAERGDSALAVAEHLLATNPRGDPEAAAQLQKAGRAALEGGHVRLAQRCLNRALAEPLSLEQQGSIHLDMVPAEMTENPSSALSHFKKALEFAASDDMETVRVGMGLLSAVANMPILRTEVLGTLRGLKNRVDAIDHEIRIEFELAMVMGSDTPAERSQSLERLKPLLAESGSKGWGMAPLAGTLVRILEQAARPMASADELVVALEETIDADQLVGGDPVVEQVQTMVHFALICADQFESATHRLELARRLARERGQRESEPRVTSLLALADLWQGSLTVAEEDCRVARHLGMELGGVHWVPPTICLVDSLVQQGKFDEAGQLDRSLRLEDIDNAVLRSSVRCQRGRILLAQGNPEMGLKEFLGAGDDLTKAGIVHPAASSWRADAAVALAALDEWDDARELADGHLRPARVFGSIRSLGIGLRAMAAATPDTAERIALLSEAVELLEGSPCRLEAAHSMVELGTALVEYRKKELARGVLRRGAHLASLCGAHELVETAGVQLRAAGARPRRLGTVGADSLTPAELRVARLAAADKTNQMIAGELFINVKTVEGHLAKTYRKLGVSSRRQLALVMSNDEEMPGASAG